MNKTTGYIGITTLVIALAFFGSKYSEELAFLTSEHSACCSDQELNNLSINLRTTACHGPCPVYSLSINSDGNLQVKGHSHVNFTNIQRQLTKEKIKQVANLVFSNNYFKIEDKYGTEGKGCIKIATDFPSHIWDITIGENTHKIHYYKGCLGAPEDLSQLHQKLVYSLNLEKELFPQRK